MSDIDSASQAAADTPDPNSDLQPDPTTSTLPMATKHSSRKRHPPYPQRRASTSAFPFDAAMLDALIFKELATTATAADTTSN
ncbi:hypothetical protein ElyMa_005762000 [Elysia marginata]|uniref:Uncharacterized protein n=1 Tax=Elysia marginata TaxID=1093978 RepID=A0AAV4FPU1_9GAST|nr:hypothetical protein ElyMa_005762000 [Elysia marginata]